MLNKNDPLIGAVQQVMQQSNAEREATRLVNEAFGVEDRKALPHEYQAEWDAVYKTVLTEGVEALDEDWDSRKRNDAEKISKKTKKMRGGVVRDFGELIAKRLKQDAVTGDDSAGKSVKAMNQLYGKMHPRKIKNMMKEDELDESNIDHPNKKKLDVAPPYGELTKKDFSTLRAMGEEEQLDELKGYRSKKGQKLLRDLQKRATKRLVKATDPMWTSKSGMSDKDRKTAKRNSDVARMADDRMNEDHLNEELLAIQEEIAYNLAEQAEYVYENYGEEGLVEFIDSLTEEQYELLEAWTDYIPNSVKRFGAAVADKVLGTEKSAQLQAKVKGTDVNVEKQQADDNAGASITQRTTGTGDVMKKNLSGETGATRFAQKTAGVERQNPIKPVGTKTSNVRKGASGSDVSDIQKQLGVSADGKFGGKTKQAVMDFQKKHGLKVDGIVGDQTRSAMARVKGAQALRDADPAGAKDLAKQQIKKAQTDAGNKSSITTTSTIGGKRILPNVKAMQPSASAGFGRTVSEAIRDIISERYAGQQGAGGAPAVRPRSFLKPDAVKSGGSMPTSGVASTTFTPAGSMNPLDRRTDMQRATQNAGAMSVARSKASAPRPGERVPGEKVGTNAQLTAQAKARQGFGAPAGGNYQSAQAKAPSSGAPTMKPGTSLNRPTGWNSFTGQGTAPVVQPANPMMGEKKPKPFAPGVAAAAKRADMSGGSGDYRSAQTKVPPGTQQKVKKGDTMWGYAKQDIKQSRNLAASGPLGGNAFGGNAGTSGAELVKRKITNKDIAAKTEKIKALNPTVNPRKMQIGSTIKTN